MKTISVLFSSLLLAAIGGAGCKTSTATGEPKSTSSFAQTPPVIYVTDFDLGARNIQHEDGLLSGRSGPVGRVGERLSGASTDPQTRARQLVDLMSNTLVKELTKSGLSPIRLPPGSKPAQAGWLLRGAFVQVDEGNRVRRAMIGFGQGQTDIAVFAVVDDLAKGEPKPLFEMAAEASSGKMPGAAPTLALGPYGAAARFVMAGKDLEKDVKQTAAEIARRISNRVAQGR